VTAAVRTADAIDRVQGREQHYDRGGYQPSHRLIILCILGKGAAGGTVISDVARDIVFALLVERFRLRSKMKSDMGRESRRGRNNGRTTNRLHVDV
jgi:hypothetical protein